MMKTSEVIALHGKENSSSNEEQNLLGQRANNDYQLLAIFQIYFHACRTQEEAMKCLLRPYGISTKIAEIGQIWS